ncbi:MAG: hypothetical protein U1D30_20095 [Planctomycetota bacterium]
MARDIRKLRYALQGVFALTLLAASQADAAFIPYTINSAQSQINLNATGTAFGGALVVTEQFPTLVTRYSGTIGTDSTVSGTSFTDGGAASALNMRQGGFLNLEAQVTPNVNGAAGTAPANYGLRLDAPVVYDLPSFDLSFLNIPGITTVDFGVLQSVQMNVAVRNLVLDFTSPALSGVSVYSGTFDPTETSVVIDQGYADITANLVLRQPNLLTKVAIQSALTLLAGSFPDLGIVVSTPNFLSLDILVGLGTRLDLANAVPIANTSATPGTLSTVWNPVGNDISTLVLPVEFAGLSGLGLPPELLDLQFNFTGTLRATAVVPEASSLLMVGAAFAGMGGLAWRRRRVAK